MKCFQVFDELADRLSHLVGIRQVFDEFTNLLFSRRGVLFNRIERDRDDPELVLVEFFFGIAPLGHFGKAWSACCGPQIEKGGVSRRLRDRKEFCYFAVESRIAELWNWGWIQNHDTPTRTRARWNRSRRSEVFGGRPSCGCGRFTGSLLECVALARGEIRKALLLASRPMNNQVADLIFGRKAEVNPFR